MKLITALSALLVIGAAHGQSADADVGTCVGYLAITNREGGPEAAMELANDKRVATQHAKIFIQKWRAIGPDLSGGNACRRLGIFPSDYRMNKKK